MSLIDILADVAREVGKSSAKKTTTRRKTVKKAAPKRRTTTRKATTRTTTAKKTTARRTSAKDDLGKMVKDILGAGKKTQGRQSTVSKTVRRTQTTTRKRPTQPKGIEDLLGKGGIGDLIGAVLKSTSAAKTVAKQRSAEEELQAALMLRVMISAIKADGKMDAAEKKRLMSAMGKASEAEIGFVNAELSGKTDIDKLVTDIPRGLEEKAYVAALMAIDLDQRAEAEFLHSFAQALGLAPKEVDALHRACNAPTIYG